MLGISGLLLVGEDDNPLFIAISLYFIAITAAIQEAESRTRSCTSMELIGAVIFFFFFLTVKIENRGSILTFEFHCALPRSINRR